MMAGKTNKYLAVLIVLLASCVEPFDPPVRDEEVGFLVVDGYLDTESDLATVVLSRAVSLSADNNFPRELGATVTLQEEGGKRYTLLPLKNGIYQLSDPGFDNTKRYQLQIRTAGRNEYQSEFITPKVAPPIDSITWAATEEGVTIRINTEDPFNKTKYYRWEYVEAWQYESPLSSEYKVVNGAAVPRPPEEQIKTCFAEKTSGEIIIGTTTNFTDDKFVNQEIAFVPFMSQKTRLHYSVLVRQFALSEDAYAYWQQLAINTESLGGLFDPQPSQLRGNIENINDTNEPVIGYFDGGSISEKRLFIKYLELPDYLQVYPAPTCVTEIIPPHRVNEVGNFYLLTNAVYDGIFLIGYNFTVPECADCRVQGGKVQKPAFWPN